MVNRSAGLHRDWRVSPQGIPGRGPSERDRRAPRERSEQCSKPRREPATVNRLRQTRRRSDGQELVPATGIVASRQHDDWNMRSRRRAADGANDTVAIQLRHLQISDDHVEVVTGSKAFDARLAVISGLDLEAGLTEHSGGKHANHGIVVDEQHAPSSLSVHATAPRRACEPHRARRTDLPSPSSPQVDLLVFQFARGSTRASRSGSPRWRPRPL